MLLNRFERAMMNNPVRAAFQRHLEGRMLFEMGGPMEGGLALEVGCGRGVGTQIIFDRFKADRVHAFDLDPDMVALAQGRLRKRGDAVRLWAGTVTQIDAPDDTYNAVFDFGIIHHVPDWRSALAEVFRVLKPGGRFYAEEVLRHFIDNPVWRLLLDHPRSDRFDQHEFAVQLADCGFEIVARRFLWRQFAWFVADKPG